MTDEQALNAKILGLENALREQRETLRDKFACQAMQMRFGAAGQSISMETMAALAYQMADTMLAARKVQ